MIVVVKWRNTTIARQPLTTEEKGAVTPHQSSDLSHYTQTTSLVTDEYSGGRRESLETVAK